MIEVSLDEEAAAMLDRLAQTRGTTKSEIVRLALRRYAEKYDEVVRAGIDRQMSLLATLPVTQEDKDWNSMALGWDDPDEPSAIAAE